MDIEVLFPKPKVRGENEREIYKNFVKDYPRGYLEMFMRARFNKFLLSIKDDVKSATIRRIGNETFSNSTQYNKCLELYSESLLFATYKSESYAIALANRSAVLFKLCHYEKCVQDIDLCLDARYPNNLKPKVYLRKCRSFKYMRKPEDMMKTADELLNFLDNLGCSATAERYKMQLSTIICGDTITIKMSKDCCSELPSIDENEALPGASKNLGLKKDQNGHYYVCSSTPIKKGQVLFVEKAYASSLLEHKTKYCQYCLISLINGVPCTGCVKYMYCNEVCQTLAWNEFHQWECYGDQADIFDGLNELMLALRIVFKACQNETIPPEKNIPMNKYSLIYYLHPILHKSENLQDDVENTMVVVNYLKTRTTFFEFLKSHRNFCNKSDKDLIATIGGLLIRHVSQIRSKALRVEDFMNLKGYDVGIVACSTVFQMTHSCNPNTICFFHKDIAIVKALTDIDANTRLTYAYGHITFYNLNLKERKKLLWDLFRLDCKCLYCSNSFMHLEKLDAYICIRCKGPAIVESSELPEPRYKCLGCDLTFKMPEEIKSKIGLFHISLQRFYSMKLIDAAEKALDIGKTFLQPYHNHFRKLYGEMANYYIDCNPAKVLLMLKLLLQVYEKRTEVPTSSIIFIQISYCEKVLSCLEAHEDLFLSEAFKTAFDDVKIVLEKVEKFSSLFCHPLLSVLKPLQLKHSYMELARRMHGTIAH